MKFTQELICLLNGKENWATWKFKIIILLRSQPGVMDVKEGNLLATTAEGNETEAAEVTL